MEDQAAVFLGSEQHMRTARALSRDRPHTYGTLLELHHKAYTSRGMDMDSVPNRRLLYCTVAETIRVMDRTNHEQDIDQLPHELEEAGEIYVNQGISHLREYNQSRLDSEPDDQLDLDST